MAWAGHGPGETLAGTFPPRASSFGPQAAGTDAPTGTLTREQGETLQALPHVRYVSVEEWGEATWTVSTPYRSTRQDITVGGVGPEAEPAHGG